MNSFVHEWWQATWVQMQQNNFAITMFHRWGKVPLLEFNEFSLFSKHKDSHLNQKVPSVLKIFVQFFFSPDLTLLFTVAQRSVTTSSSPRLVMDWMIIVLDSLHLYTNKRSTLHLKLYFCCIISIVQWQQRSFPFQTVYKCGLVYSGLVESKSFTDNL